MCLCVSCAARSDSWKEHNLRAHCFEAMGDVFQHWVDPEEGTRFVAFAQRYELRNNAADAFLRGESDRAGVARGLEKGQGC